MEICCEKNVTSSDEMDKHLRPFISLSLSLSASVSLWVIFRSPVVKGLSRFPGLSRPEKEGSAWVQPDFLTLYIVARELQEVFFIGNVLWCLSKKWSSM